MLKPTLVFDVCILTDEKMSLLHNQQAIPKSIKKKQVLLLILATDVPEVVNMKENDNDPDV